jgi:metallo-beta-lactamase class B
MTGSCRRRGVAAAFFATLVTVASVAGNAMIKQLTGARYMVMDGDAPVVESGGKADFQYGTTPAFLYPPTRVDRVLHDGDEVKLGDAVLVAHLTPGHTNTLYPRIAEDYERTFRVLKSLPGDYALS